MDIIYVVYFDGEMYKGYNYKKRKSTYTRIGSAKQIVTFDSEYIASQMCEENNIDYYYLKDVERKEWIDKARQRFEIKEFVERGDE